MPLVVHRDVAAPPPVVWSLLVDLEAWPLWGPTVTGAELDEGSTLAAGARGRVRTPIGVSLPFVVTTFEPERRWAWRVAGVPATTHAVAPAGGGTRVSMGAPLWAPAYLPVLTEALRRIDQLSRER